MDNINITTSFGTIGINFFYDRILPQVTSDEYRIFFVRSGTAALFLRQTREKYFIKRYDIISVSPGAEFSLSRKENLSLFCLSFDRRYCTCQLGEIVSGKGFRDLFSEDAGGIKSFRRSLADHDKVYYLIKDIFNEAEKKDLGYRMIINARFAEILIILSRSPSGEAELCSKPVSQAVFEAAEYMEKNFTLDITAEKLASYVSLSPRHLARMFGKAYGMSPMKYLEGLRMKNAAEMLVSTDKTVTEISFDCGYNDSNYFSKQFKRYYSGTPAQYRKNRRRAGSAPDFGD